MAEATTALRRKISVAGDLQAVVRTMKALAASSVGQYERSVRALGGYYRVVELGLGRCLRDEHVAPGDATSARDASAEPIDVVVFGSDQGLVGQFNDVVADFAVETLRHLRGDMRVWAVGARVRARLADAALPLAGTFDVPTSVKAIAPLVARIQIETELSRAAREREYARLHVIHNRPGVGSPYDPVSQKLLPLDAGWQADLAKIPWPTRQVAELMCSRSATLLSLVREYLFISLFRACAESLASENASRLAAMERAERNIEELLGNLRGALNRVRQATIDEELFDVVAGAESSPRD